MNAPTPPELFLPLDLAAVRAEGHHPTNTLDLDLMAHLAEEAGRDALQGRADQAPFDASHTLRAIATTDDLLVTATRLYQACLRGALDPATD